MPEIANGKSPREPLIPQADADQGISIGEILQMLWKHWLFIILCSLICFSLALAYVLVTRPVYEATATVRMDPGRTGSLGLSDLGSSGSDASVQTRTEMAMMQTDGVALRTLRDLPDDEFQAVTGETKAEAKLPERVQELTPDQADLLGYIQGPLTIKEQEGTSLISISFKGPNPKLAAELVNHLVAAYQVQSFIDRDQSVSQLNTWLSSQMTSLKNQADTAQRKLADFEQRNNVITTEGSTSNTITDRLRDLSARLTTVQADRIVKEGQLRAAQTGNLESLAALFPTSRLQALEGEQAAVSGKYQQLRAKFGANYPPLMEAEKQLKIVNNEVSAEIQAIRGRLQEEYNAAKTTEGLLQNEYDQQTKLVFAFDRNAADYAVLQAEVTSSRTLYDTLQHKIQQAGVDAQISGLNTMPIDYALTPAVPVAPKRGLILGGGLLLGLIAGIAAAILMEVSSDKLHNAADLAKVAPFPILSSIPGYPKKRRLSSASPLAVSSSEPAELAEAYRGLRNVLLLASSEQGFKSLMFTGVSRQEQAGEVVANLGLALAQAHQRVLLVDADLQEPSLHHFFGASNEGGLRGLLHGSEDHDVFVHPMPAYPNLTLLPAGTSQGSSTDELTQQSFRQALAQWRSNFDFVLIKAAPMAEQSSGLLLAHWADRLLVLVRFQETRLQALRTLYPLTELAGASVLGVVIENAAKTS